MLPFILLFSYGCNSTDKDTKSLLRASKTPVEAIKLFDKLNG